MDFIEKYGKQIFAGLGLVVVIALVTTVVSSTSASKEKSAQEKFFALDVKVKKYKEEQSKTADEKAKEQTASVSIDVEQLKTELNSFISSESGTVAAQFAGLELAQILSEQGNTAEALSTLQKVETKSQVLSNVLVRMKIAQYLADQDKCNEALAIWSKVIASGSSNYIHAEAKINQALCYKKLNDLVKAEELLNQVKNEKGDDAAEVSREAERVLRLIQFNKSFGT